MTSAQQLAADVDALVAAMVSMPWPTTAAEHAAWAAEVGLPSSGDVDEQMNTWSPGAAHFTAPAHPWMLSWHFFRDEFIGVSLFPGNDLAPLERLSFARALCGNFDARWDAEERLDASPPLTGFTTYWLPGECMVDLYWHAPQVDPLGIGQQGSVQLAVTHHARAQAEDHESSNTPATERASSMRWRHVPPS